MVETWVSHETKARIEGQFQKPIFGITLLKEEEAHHIIPDLPLIVQHLYIEVALEDLAEDQVEVVQHENSKQKGNNRL